METIKDLHRHLARQLKFNRQRTAKQQTKILNTQNLNAMTQTATATGLQTKALTVNLTICQWSARKHDKKITKEVADTHNAKDDAGRYNKLLVAKKDLEAIQKIANAARIFHYENTLPWGDNGERLLPSANYMTYTKEMSFYKNQFENAVADFVSNYDSVIDDAKVRLNGMFDSKDYPSKLEIESKFKISASFMPLPEIDIRLNLSQTEINNLTQQIENSFRERIAGAVADTWNRIKDQLTHMQERLTTVTEEGKPAIFKDSLFDNLKDLINILPKLNVTGDANIAAICEQMKGLIADPDSVRSSAHLRPYHFELFLLFWN